MTNYVQHDWSVYAWVLLLATMVTLTTALLGLYLVMANRPKADRHTEPVGDGRGMDRGIDEGTSAKPEVPHAA